MRVESSKFEQQKEEWMDVEGEAEVDVDIMKELRYGNFPVEGQHVPSRKAVGKRMK